MSIETLTKRDTITVFEPTAAQDDMMNWVDTQSTIRRKIQCRMVPMSRDEKILHGLDLLEEVYLAYFGVDPELTLKHRVIYDGKVFNIESNKNASGQGWVWEVMLRHHPGLEIAV